MLRVALKKLARKLVRKKVKNLLLTTVKHALSVSLYEGIIFLSYFKKENKEMSEKRCYTVQELQEILGVSRSTTVSYTHLDVYKRQTLYCIG